jgi:hypothetical protein
LIDLLDSFWQFVPAHSGSNRPQISVKISIAQGFSKTPPRDVTWPDWIFDRCGNHGGTLLLFLENIISIC